MPNSSCGARTGEPASACGPRPVWDIGRKLAIGAAGATNAALLAAAIIANGDAAVLAALEAFRAAQTRKVLSQPDPRQPPLE